MAEGILKVWLWPLVSWLLVNQKSDYPRWTWPNQSNLLKMSELFKLELERLSCCPCRRKILWCREGQIAENDKDSVGAEKDQIYNQEERDLSSTPTSDWVLPTTGEFGREH